MRTRLDVEAEMISTVADARSAAAESDDVSYEIDHHRLADLLTEWQAIPLQRTP
jgi:hypothetical protein